MTSAATDLHTAGHRRGVVATPHHAAVEAGRAIIAEGGNALEAMVAMAAAIATVYPHMSQVGGDGFWLVREPAGRVRALMAPGRAGSNARRELYREYETVPARGPLAALTVPGAVSGWMLALEAARAQGGRMPLPDLLAPAIRHANDGYIVTPGQARLTAENLAELKDVPGFAATFLTDGKPPDAGRRLHQSALAATLDHLAHAGLDDFYRGDVGREIAADLERVGSPVTRDDLERCCASAAEPLSVALDCGTAFNTPPPTQGLASLMILALFERLRVPRGEGFEDVNGLIETTKRAFGVRDRVITDPAHLPHPLDRYLEPKFLDAEARKIDRRKAAHWPAPYGEGDTVWMGAADATGLVVSYIQSLYWEFGSGVVLPQTGVVMQNRGASFSLRARSMRWCPAGCRSTRSIPPLWCSPTAASSATAPWVATASRRRRPRCSPAMCATAWRSTARSTRRAGSSAAPGARATPICAWKRASTTSWSTACSRPAMTSRCCRTPIPTSWAMPARSCCTAMERSKGCMIRAPTAGRQAYRFASIAMS
jgi:gamma-glutamyltranspeptidase/glutathione hydrolase